MKTVYRVSQTSQEAHLFRPGNKSMVRAKITEESYCLDVDPVAVADFSTEKDALEFVQKQDLTPMIKPANAGGWLLLWDAYFIDKVFIGDDGCEEYSDNCADGQMVSQTVDQLISFVEQRLNGEDDED